jgi:hypothetical protein
MAYTFTKGRAYRFIDQQAVPDETKRQYRQTVEDFIAKYSPGTFGDVSSGQQMVTDFCALWREGHRAEVTAQLTAQMAAMSTPQVPVETQIDAAIAALFCPVAYIDVADASGSGNSIIV